MSDKKQNEEHKQILQDMFDAVITGNFTLSEELAKLALKAKMPPMDAVEKGLTPGIREVGERFSRGDAYLPEMVLAAKTMKAAVDVLQAAFGKKLADSKGKVLLCSIKGDIHDIGKNIVSAILKVNGYEVIDLGRDIAPDRLVDSAEELRVDIIAMSCLLTTSLPFMGEAIELLKESGLDNKYRTIIGGSPVTKKFADEIGADGYAATAADGVVVCDQLMETFF